MGFTLTALVAGVEKDQAQHHGHDATGNDQGDGGVGQGDERRASRDQDAQGYDGDDEVNHEFVHGGIVQEASGGFRVLYWGT